MRTEALSSNPPRGTQYTCGISRNVKTCVGLGMGQHFCFCFPLFFVLLIFRFRLILPCHVYEIRAKLLWPLEESTAWRHHQRQGW
jgi:hypothetical protein